MSLISDGKRWRCWSCDASGDAVDWLVKVHGYTNVEAARSLLGLPADGTNPARKAPKRIEPSRPKPEPVPAWHSDAWQAVVLGLVEEAEAALWSKSDPGAAAVRAWLCGRGLHERTLKQFRIGYIPADRWVERIERRDGTVGPVLLRRGATFPWAAPGSDHDASHDGGPPRFCGFNVRRLNEDPAEPWVGSDKNLLITGSERGHFYPWPTMLPSQGPILALVAEGEIDALLAVQEAGHLVFAGTCGGAQTGPRPSALAILESCPTVLIATDRDQAGIDAAWAWRERLPGKTFRVLVPDANDLGDFVVAGGDLAGWIACELARLRLDRPAFARAPIDPQARFEATQPRMLRVGMAPGLAAEDEAEALAERGEIRWAEDLKGGDPEWWSDVAGWSYPDQCDFSAEAAALRRESSLSAPAAERAAYERIKARAGRI